MKSSVETLNPTRVRLTVEVPFEELKPSLDSAYKRIAAQVTIPGFRKGRVPAMIIDQRVGRGAVLDEAVNEHLPKAYNAAVDEHKVKPLGQPEVDVTAVAGRRRPHLHRRGRRPPRDRAARVHRHPGHGRRRRRSPTTTSTSSCKPARPLRAR